MQRGPKTAMRNTPYPALAQRWSSCYPLTMTKIEQLTQTAAALSDEQIDGLIAYAAYLAGQPLYYSAPPEVRASIDRGLDQYARGNTVLGTTVFDHLQVKIDAARQ